MVLRKIFHIAMIIVMTIPLYARGLLLAFPSSRLIDFLHRTLDPRLVYVELMVVTAYLNAFRIRKPISDERIAEIRKAFRETSPLGKRIDDLIASVEKTIDIMEREYEKRAGYVGLVNGMIGVTAAYLLFGDHVIYGIAALATTDTFSSLIGIGYGRRKIPLTDGTIEGTLGGFFSYFVPLILLESPAKAVILAFSASLIELFGVEDNLSVPFFVSLVAAAYSFFQG